jgi:hypothetical protein
METKSLKDLGDSFFCPATESLVKSQPYLAAVLLFAIWEFIARCRRGVESDLHKTGISQEVCSELIDQADPNPLKDYQALNAKPDCLLYKGLRCGMIHSFMPDKKIKITQGQNDLDNKVIGIEALYQDLHKAWLQVCTDQKDFVEKTSALHVDNSISGTTSN